MRLLEAGRRGTAALRLVRLLRRVPREQSLFPGARKWNSCPSSHVRDKQGSIDVPRSVTFTAGLTVPGAVAVEPRCTPSSAATCQAVQEEVLGPAGQLRAGGRGGGGRREGGRGPPGPAERAEGSG